MRKLFLFAAMLLSSFSFINAQDFDPAEMEKRILEMENQFIRESVKDLSKEQATKTDSLNVIFVKKQMKMMQEAFQNPPSDGSNPFEAFTKLNDEKDKELAKILNATQLAAYKKAYQERMERMMSGGGF